MTSSLPQGHKPLPLGHKPAGPHDGRRMALALPSAAPEHKSRQLGSRSIQVQNLTKELEPFAYNSGLRGLSSKDEVALISELVAHSAIGTFAIYGANPPNYKFSLRTPVGVQYGDLSVSENGFSENGFGHELKNFENIKLFFKKCVRDDMVQPQHLSLLVTSCREKGTITNVVAKMLPQTALLTLTNNNLTLRIKPDEKSEPAPVLLDKRIDIVGERGCCMQGKAEWLSLQERLAKCVPPVQLTHTKQGIKIPAEYIAKDPGYGTPEIFHQVLIKSFAFSPVGTVAFIPTKEMDKYTVFIRTKDKVVEGVYEVRDEHDVWQENGEGVEHSFSNFSLFKKHFGIEKTMPIIHLQLVQGRTSKDVIRYTKSNLKTGESLLVQPNPENSQLELRMILDDQRKVKWIVDVPDSGVGVCLVINGVKQKSYDTLIDLFAAEFPTIHLPGRKDQDEHKMGGPAE